MEFGRPSAFGKTDLIHLVSTRLKLRNYLELCTSTTGHNYWDIMRWRFNNSRRLMYNCPDNFDDGMPIDLKIESCDIGPAISKLKMDASKLIYVSLMDFIPMTALFAI